MHFFIFIQIWFRDERGRWIDKKSLSLLKSFKNSWNDSSLKMTLKNKISKLLNKILIIANRMLILVQMKSEKIRDESFFRRNSNTLILKSSVM